MRNILTIDVEDWYQTLDFNFHPDTWDTYESRIGNSLNTVLELLDRYAIKATFFVLGDIAKRQPDLVRKLDRSGHEIGSHGSMHRLVYKQTPKEFRRDIRESKRLLEGITGKEVTLFRASSWSISYRTLWALDILEQEGYRCDSSIQPFATPLSGMRGAPLEPFHPKLGRRRLELVEYPISVLPVGKGTMPFAGGLYLRTLPSALVQYALKKVNAEREGMIYVHPWEMDAGQPRLPVSPIIRFTHYYNLENTGKKLENLLKRFEFAPLGEVLGSRQYPCLDIAQAEGFAGKPRKTRMEGEYVEA